MQVLIIFLLIVVYITADRLEWNKFKSMYRKKYKRSFEEEYRYGVFKNNLAEIEQHNRLYENGSVTYTKGINQFADLTAKEFQTLLSLKAPKNRNNSMGYYKAPRLLLAPYVNWTAQGAVTRVKNQGSCGSCWSFSATGSIEGQYYIKTRKLVSLSEQYLVDCSRGYNYGCNGGWVDAAYYFIWLYGIPLEQNYNSYNAREGVCSWKYSSDLITIRGYIKISRDDENALISAVENVGPIAVGIHVTNNFQFYSSGVFTDYTCSKYKLNHAVLATGYNTNSIFIKNSWGTDWGENGYIRFRRGSNLCGVASEAMYPVL